MEDLSSMRTAVIFIGIPASGKTTFFSKYFMEDYIHINLDTLHTRKKEAALLVECLSNSKSFAIDNTNTKRTARERYIIPLPTIERVRDYFLWRQEDAHRNCLNAHCYWLLRRDGLSSDKATAQLEGKSIAYKNELLFQQGVNFDKIPAWQKRGVGVYWEEFQKSGLNPLTGQTEGALRRRLTVNDELPLREEYARMISTLIAPDPIMR